MCIPSIFYQFLIGILLLVIVFQTKQAYNNAKINFGVLSKLLVTPQTKWGPLSIRLEGFYKGRKAVLNYWLLGGDGIYQVEFYIELRRSLKRQKFICLRYPSPTEGTFLKGKRLFYSDHHFRKKTNRTYTEQEFADILEKLTLAAEMVENDPDRF